MVANGSVRQIESGRNDFVRKPLSGELRDVQLLRGQVLPYLLDPVKARFTGCSQLLSRTIAPGRSAKRVENVAGLAQWSPRVGGPALSAQPHAITKQEAPSQERPVLCGRPKTLQEEAFRIFIRRDQRLAVA